MKLIESTDNAFTSCAEIGAFRGAVKNVSNKSYHSIKSYWSSSDLKYMQSTSPAHFRARYFDKKIEPSEPTPAMLLGSLVHCLVLTPNEFENEYFIMPDINLRTNEGKAAKQELLAANPGKASITNDQLLEANSIRSSVLNNPKALELLEPMHKEVSFFWSCPFSGLNMKSKIDGCSSKHFIELKTTSDASPENFQRHAYNMNYDLSLIHYRNGLMNIMDCEPPAYFIVVETKPPYICQVYLAGDSLLQTGHDKWLSSITKLERGIKKKEWPQYFESTEVPTLESPSWAVNKLLKEEANGL